MSQYRSASAGRRDGPRSGRYAPAKNANRPQPYPLSPEPTMWVDFQTGAGVDSAGRRFQVVPGGRRKRPNLADLVLFAQQYRLRKIMLCGKLPAVSSTRPHWLTAEVPGHKIARAFVNREPYSASIVPDRELAPPDMADAPWFLDDPKERSIEVRTIAEWFDTQDLSPSQAQRTWALVEHVLAKAIPGVVLGRTPVVTGANAWALTLPASVEPMALEADISEEIHRTSGQHRFEHLVAGEAACPCGDCRPTIDPKQSPQLDGFAYADGRFMYAACTRELGIGPGRRLNQSKTADLLQSEGGIYAPMRVLAEFTVPKDWEHVGLIGVQHENVADGWHYPNQPGARFTSWVGGPEFLLAVRYGWNAMPYEAVTFTKGRPLDTWGRNLTKARDELTQHPNIDPEVRAAGAAALRSILLQAIGNFAKRLRGTDVVVADPRDIPPELAGTARKYGDKYVFESPGRAPTPRDRAFYHPELAAQVWSRARTRVLESRLPDGISIPEGEPRFAGLLSMDPATIIGVNGDAIYSTAMPWWALPAQDGGADDGRVGRLRAKGYLSGPIKTPRTREERLKLRTKAERAGWSQGREIV